MKPDTWPDRGSNFMAVTSLIDHAKTTTGTGIIPEWGLSLHLKRNDSFLTFR